MPILRTGTHPGVRSILAASAVFSATPLSAQLPPGNWQYLWGDDFSGRSVDTSKWNIASPGWTMPNSLSAASADKVRVGEGALTMDATRTATEGSVQFSSGSVSTYQKRNFNGGYIEARIWLPDTPGSWPAFWGLYDGWPPECDIMEYPIDTAAGNGYAQDQYHTAFHYVNGSGGNSAGAGQVNPAGIGDLGGAWHHFAVNWVEDSSVTFYFNGQQVSSFNSAADVAEMAHMYLILDYAVGGWPGTPNTGEWPLGFTDETKVDWVRVWNSAPSKTSNWTYSGPTEYQLWSTAANWSNGEPNLGGVTSSFTTGTASEYRLDWSGSRTLSVINLDGGTRYQFGWPGDRLVLGFGDNGSIRPTVNVAPSTTRSHEIQGDLEWSGDLFINNASTQPLLITGRTYGGDSVIINGSSNQSGIDDGTGVVVFSGNDNDRSHSGATVLDSGTRGAAVARVRGRNSLGSGPVLVGLGGNDTTARLELEDGGTVSGEITLGGRPPTNANPGILSLGGNNLITGRVTGQTGGSDYRIRSDAGELRLPGASAGGVAFTNLASGSRKLTLDGSGDGTISGRIENGSATVSLEKSGSGTWTLGGANDYGGATTVAAGELVVNGNTGSGTTTVEETATLSGGGSVSGSLNALNGSTIRIGAAGLSPAFSLIDDFESYPTGSIGASPNTTGDVWTGVFDGTANARIATTGGSRVLEVNGINAVSASWRGAITDLASSRAGDFSLPHGETGTYFLRVMSSGSASTDFIFGLTDHAASTSATPGNDTGDPWDDYAVTLSVFNGNLRGFGIGIGDVNVAPIGSNQWLNVWLIVDNAAKTYQVATSTGTADGTLSPTLFNFGRRTAAADALVTFGLHERLNIAGRIDDLHFSPGTSTSNPMAPVTQLRAETLSIGSGFDLASGATLEFDISSPTLHDRLQVAGPLNASGTLRLTLDPGAPNPSPGDRYDLFASSGGSIAFSAYDLPSLPEGLAWDTSSIPTGVVEIVADPATYAGWALGQSFDPGDGDPSLDLEPDGLENAFEWLLGGDPRIPDTHLLPPASLRNVADGLWEGADASKTYIGIAAIVRKNISGMTLLPQAASSPDLLDAPGSSDRIFTRQLSDLGEFEHREWIHTIPVEDAARAFMRLKLTGE